jgi:AcrR family transcriptional regulator
MNAALEIFSREDFHKATMRSIAREADVTTSIIYKHFKNKDELYVTLISTIIDRANNELNIILEGLSGIKNKVYKISRYYLDFYQENYPIAHMVYASTNLNYWYEYEKAFETARESGSFLIRIIIEGQKNGEVRKDLDLRIISHIYHGALHHMVINWLYNNRSYKLSDSADSLAEVIYRAIRLEQNERPQFTCPFLSQEHNLQAKPPRHGNKPKSRV